MSKFLLRNKTSTWLPQRYNTLVKELGSSISIKTSTTHTFKPNPIDVTMQVKWRPQHKVLSGLGTLYRNTLYWTPSTSKNLWQIAIHLLFTSANFFIWQMPRRIPVPSTTNNLCCNVCSKLHYCLFTNSVVFCILLIITLITISCLGFSAFSYF